jgi:LAO/AO transport system kinase
LHTAVQDISKTIQLISEGNFATLAKCITAVENGLPESQTLLKALPVNNHCTVIGITGAPGAGKSTLTNCLLENFTQQNKKVAVLSVDPSSPFNFGALLGDRIRMADFYLNPLVYIRSLASRGALGGLHPKIIEIIELVKAAQFDYIIVETVGVGQSEVDIAGLADTTLVMVVPEGGDEVQTMKAGVMEIADIFIVNKCDRPQANSFVKNLNALVHSRMVNAWQVPVVKCVASKNEGIDILVEHIQKHASYNQTNAERKILLYTNKLLQLIVQNKMQHINKMEVLKAVRKDVDSNSFNLFEMLENYISPK